MYLDHTLLWAQGVLTLIVGLLSLAAAGLIYLRLGGMQPGLKWALIVFAVVFGVWRIISAVFTFVAELPIGFQGTEMAFALNLFLMISAIMLVSYLYSYRGLRADRTEMRQSRERKVEREVEQDDDCGC